MLKKKHEAAETVPKGKPKSGRIWKEQRQRFSAIIKTKGIRNSLERKKQLKEQLTRAKQASKELRSIKQEEKEKKKERRRENLKRQEQNKRKAEVVQVITNTAKLKKMKKKQLRHIEKRDTSM